MKQDYFIYNGKKYFTGTVCIINKYDSLQRSFVETEVKFIYYDTEKNYIAFKIKHDKNFWPEKLFLKELVKVIDEIDPSVHMPKEMQMKDSEILGMKEGWGIYLLIMAITTIFYWRIPIWITATIIFIEWRKKKIKEGGTYYEW